MAGLHAITHKPSVPLMEHTREKKKKPNLGWVERENVESEGKKKHESENCGVERGIEKRKIERVRRG